MTFLKPRAIRKGGRTVDFPDPVPVLTIILSLDSISFLKWGRCGTIGKFNVKSIVTRVLNEIIIGITAYLSNLLSINDWSKILILGDIIYLIWLAFFYAWR